MASELFDNLTLNRSETIDFYRDMIHPDMDSIRRRDEFLQEVNDATIIISNGSIIIEGLNFAQFDDEQRIYDTQIVETNSRGRVSFVNRVVGFDYSSVNPGAQTNSSSKERQWPYNRETNESISIVEAA